MMQNSPLLVTKVNPTNKPKEMMVKEKQPSETGQTFKQMLSKQVEQSGAKTTEDKKNKLKTDDKQRAEAKEKTLAEAEPTETATNSAASTANAAVGEGNSMALADAQALASEVTSKTVKEVTDGAVDLDAIKETDVSHTGIASVAPSIVASAKVADSAVQVSDQSVDSNQLAKAGFTNLSPSIQSNNPVGSATKASSDAVASATKGFDNLSSANTKPVKSEPDAKATIKDSASIDNTGAALDETAFGKDQFANQLIAEKNTKSSQEMTFTQTSNNITEISAASIMTAQVSGKQATPIEASQNNLSNFINVAPGKPGWSEAIGQKVVWMVGAAEQSATLTLNPKDLGPLQIIINVNNEKADATFITENPEVRKALEDGMSTLKQSMSQAGVELGQANVNTGKEQQAFQQANQEHTQRQSRVGNEPQGSEIVHQKPIVTRVSNGLVDTFA